MAKIIEAGDRQYELVEGWGELPRRLEVGPGRRAWRWTPATTSTSSRAASTRTWSSTRAARWSTAGARASSKTPTACASRPTTRCTSSTAQPQIVLKFNKEGKHRLTLGTRGQPLRHGLHPGDARAVGDPNLSGGGMPVTQRRRPRRPALPSPDRRQRRARRRRSTSRTAIATAASTSTPRTARCSSPGAKPGSAEDLRDTTDKPDYFHTVHSVWEHEGKVYVADRENNRIQIFDPDGEFLDMWTGFGRPTKLYVDPRETSCTWPSSRTASASSTWRAT